MVTELDNNINNTCSFIRHWRYFRQFCSIGNKYVMIKLFAEISRKRSFTITMAAYVCCSYFENQTRLCLWLQILQTGNSNVKRCTSVIREVKECQIYNKEILNISDFNYLGKIQTNTHFERSNPFNCSPSSFVSDIEGLDSLNFTVFSLPLVSSPLMASCTYVCRL